MLNNKNNIIKRIVLVGNGFDLAHGLRTAYKQFAETYIEHPEIKRFRRCVELLNRKNQFFDELGRSMNITWYSFEENMQRIMMQEYEKATNGKVDADETCTEFNDLFAKIESLLAEYLRNVYEVIQFRTRRCRKEYI